MRDQYRSKQELCDELAGLRKQVADLKAEMVIRRRVEDALRHSEELLRALGDSAPTGLCLMRPGGTVRAANLPFARLLGYESAAELQRLSEAFGLFADPDELSRSRGIGVVSDLVTGARGMAEALIEMELDETFVQADVFERVDRIERIRRLISDEDDPIMRMELYAYADHAVSARLDLHGMRVGRDDVHQSGPFAALLTKYGATRFVTGHTPQANRSINVRYGGRAVLIDTGMLPYYKGRASALEIDGAKLTAIYEDGKVTLP